MRMRKTQRKMRNERWMIEKRYCLTWMDGDNRGQDRAKVGKSEYIED